MYLKLQICLFYSEASSIRMYIYVYMYMYLYIYINIYICYIYIYYIIYIYIYIYIYSITVGAISAGKSNHALDCIDFITETVDLVINRAF